MSAAIPLSGTEVHGMEGRTLGGFRMAHEIACGGMATVYLGHKPGPMGITQQAAVKVIHPHLARDRDFVEMFLDEARIVSCINHPNVCRVLDFGKAEGTYYLAMEYVMGETWADVLNALKGVPEARAILPALLACVLAQASEGLHAAHEAQDTDGRPLQIVHRDVSPQNIIVGYDGSVRVLDFGIASAAEKLHTTRNGTIKGRFAYMAPEQMRGMPVDRRADVWSLGVVLWEGLSQQRLFKRDTEAETILAVTADPMPSLEACGVPIPPALVRATDRALAREREQRFSTARELGLELSRFAASSLVPVGLPEVSLWMHRLFAERIEKKRLMIRDSAKAADREATPASIPPPKLFDPGPDSALQTGAHPKSSATAEHSGIPSISAIRELPRATKSKSKLVVALLVAGLVAGALLLSGRSEGPPQNARAKTEILHAAAAPSQKDEPKHAPLPTSEGTANEAAATPNQDANGPQVTPLAPIRAEATPPTKAREPVETQPRRPRETATGPSAINIVTPGGWAEVYEGNKKLGTTPARFQLPSGPHVLRLRPFGTGKEIVRKVQLTAGSTLKLKVPVE